MATNERPAGDEEFEGGGGLMGTPMDPRLRRLPTIQEEEEAERAFDIQCLRAEVKSGNRRLPLSLDQEEALAEEDLED